MADTSKVDNELLDWFAKMSAQATPGPWYVRCMDDEHCMMSYGVSNIDAGDVHEDWTSSHWPTKELIAVTLLQAPYTVVPEGRKWFENACLIASMRTHIEELVRLAKIGKEVEEAQGKSD